VSTTAIVVAVPASVAFLLLLLWVIGRAVTAVASRTPADAGRPRQYLAGRLYGVQVIAIVTCDDELLVSLAVQGAGEIPGAFRISAGEWPLARVERWRDEGTLLRGYLSEDGAVMLADHVLGGNAGCEPAVTLT
jgi:hypothetical protein